VHGAEQCGEWVGDVDRVLAEREEDLWATEVEVIAAQGDDAGDALAVQQDEAARDAGGQLERVVVEQRAGLAQAGGVIDRGAARLRRSRLTCRAGSRSAWWAQSRKSRVGSARLGASATQSSTSGWRRCWSARSWSWSQAVSLTAARSLA